MDAVRVVLYALAVLASLSCTVLLFRAWTRRRFRLLLWSGICFAGLTVNNVLLFFDLVVFTSVDLRLPRLIASLAGILVMLYAFIWETD